MTINMRPYIIPLILLVCLTGCSEERETITVQEENIIESVYSSVVVEPSFVYKVNSTVSGYISVINFSPGDRVEAGDVVFQIRDVQGDKTTSNAELAYQLAQKNYSGDQSALDDLRLEIENAKLKRKNDSINNSRNVALFEKNIITKVEMEQSELIFNASKNAHTSLINRYKRLDRELRTSMEQARNNYNATLSRSDDALIRSKISGKIYDITKETEELVMSQEPIAIIGTDSSFILKMLIDEVDITKVKLGQEIIVSLEAYKNQVFEAKITRIAPKMDSRTQTFEIEGVFTKAPEALYMGLTGEGNIVINSRKGVLVIPLEYLMDGNRVETSNGIVDVQIGAKSLSHVEIIAGLQKGDVVYKP